jgi:hypothetical protein
MGTVVVTAAGTVDDGVAFALPPLLRVVSTTAMMPTMVATAAMTAKSGHRGARVAGDPGTGAGIALDRK